MLMKSFAFEQVKMFKVCIGLEKRAKTLGSLRKQECSQTKHGSTIQAIQSDTQNLVKQIHTREASVLSTDRQANLGILKIFYNFGFAAQTAEAFIRLNVCNCDSKSDFVIFFVDKIP